MLLQDPINSLDDKSESRLYVGNLDLRISEAALIKMFSPYGKIVAEDFLWHTRGPKRGEPRGYAFVQFSTKEEAVLAKEKMHGKLVCGRPLVVRLASEKYFMEGAESSFGAGGETSKSNFVAGSSAQMSKTAKIAAIKNKLKAMEEENQNSKRPKTADKLSDS
ncbi:uncharacterized protein LOC107807160 isoform X1 [Nicotiana tabacum]|uniref:Probable RNA-binding protein 18 n=1 Tax=Nicotiana tabacum TaxID=4097 RepID=A0A1S4BDP0_TOBAC|nr:probable RNA-binding protein 18 isoform X1 [Nicotiana tomentosiformis]XP_016486972.1 PREDICTED: probable RNA-binding protein 18 isoform X1 [Nicotiana tabacum]